MRKAKAIRVVLIDDSVVVLDGITSILRSVPDIEVVGVLTNGLNAATRVASISADVVVVDAQMPELDGVAVTRNIKGILPEVGVLYMTVHPGSIDAALDAGADAYLMKDSGCQEFADAIRLVARRSSPNQPDDQRREKPGSGLLSRH